MKGWLVYTKEDAKRNESFIEWIMDEANQIGLTLQLRYKENFLLGVKDNQLYLSYDREEKLPEFAIIRTIDPLFSQQLEFMGITIFNTSTVSTICNDKGKTHQFLATQHIPMLDTYFLTTEQDIERVPLIYPFIIKEVEGRGGKQVYLVQSKDEWKKLIPRLTSRSIIAQKFADVPGKDVRVFVVGKEIIAAVLRSSETNFKANYTLGGHASLYQLSSKEITIVQKIIDLFDPIGFVGIDFMFDKNGDFIFNEIEDVVGSRTLSAHSTINIVSIYLNYIKKQLQKPQK